MLLMRIGLVSNQALTLHGVHTSVTEWVVETSVGRQQVEQSVRCAIIPLIRTRRASNIISIPKSRGDTSIQDALAFFLNPPMSCDGTQLRTLRRNWRQMRGLRLLKRRSWACSILRAAALLLALPQVQRTDIMLAKVKQMLTEKFSQILVIIQS